MACQGKHSPKLLPSPAVSAASTKVCNEPVCFHHAEPGQVQAPTPQLRQRPNQEDPEEEEVPSMADVGMGDGGHVTMSHLQLSTPGNSDTESLSTTRDRTPQSRGVRLQELLLLGPVLCVVVRCCCSSFVCPAR